MGGLGASWLRAYVPIGDEKAEEEKDRIFFNLQNAAFALG